MAQGKQDKLIVWLECNKLDFIKDALISVDYTLDMIVNMTDEEMIGIFDELKISNLNRPRFRTAVIQLKKQRSRNKLKSPVQAPPSSLSMTKTFNNKTNKNTNKIETKEETLESLLSVGDSQRLINPYVIICAIEDYSESEPKGIWKNLNGVKIDVKNMIHLWNDIYNYKHTSLAFKNSENDNNSNNSKDSMNNSETFHDFLVDSRARININKCYDGLIFYYSGHGLKNGIVLANGKRYEIKDIIEIFNGKNCVCLRNKPKIMIFDCCRGCDISQTYEIKSDDNSNKTLKGPNNPQNGWINRKYHINSGLATIFSNFEDFSISDSDTHGGCLTRSIYKIFCDPSKACKYSLRELMIGVRRQTKINSGYGNTECGVPTELVDFHETLEYKVYFDKCEISGNQNNNNNNNNSDNVKEEVQGFQSHKQQPEKHVQQEFASIDDGKMTDNADNNADNNNQSIKSPLRSADVKKDAVPMSKEGEREEEQQQGSQSEKQMQKCDHDQKEEINDIDWRFDFHHDHLNKGCKHHGIGKNGKHFECNDGYCSCFSTINKYGMVRNSGIYKIKLKIDKIYNGHYSYGNMIGLTSVNWINESSDLVDCEYKWHVNCNNWIGWTARDKEDDVGLPNGLYCGEGDSGRRDNIFRRSGVKYASRNGIYLSKLPCLKSGDIAVMIYNSDLGQLSFELYKDNKQFSLLESYIYNLPHLTFYWFFGHSRQQMSITILD